MRCQDIQWTRWSVAQGRNVRLNAEAIKFSNACLLPYFHLPSPTPHRYVLPCDQDIVGKAHGAFEALHSVVSLLRNNTMCLSTLIEASCQDTL